MTARVCLQSGRVRDSLGFPTPSFLIIDTVRSLSLELYFKIWRRIFGENSVDNLPVNGVELEVVQTPIELVCQHHAQRLFYLTLLISVLAP